MTRLFIIFILCVFSFSAYSQRCGGKLVFRIYEENDKTIYPSVNDSILLYSMHDQLLYSNFKSLDTTYNFRIFDLDLDKSIDSSQRGKNLIYFYNATGCGLGSWKISIEKGSRKMEIDFRNLAMEIDYLVDSIPFKQGKYSIECTPEYLLHQEGAAKVVDDLRWGYIIPAAANLKKE